MFYQVCFDIVEDKTRRLVVKIIKNHGVRVQKSVFECADLTEKQFLKMKDDIEQVIDHLSDSVRYYSLCRHCLKQVEFSGLGEIPMMEDYEVV